VGATVGGGVPSASQRLVFPSRRVLTERAGARVCLQPGDPTLADRGAVLAAVAHPR
jgi:hypothetical protein